MGDRFYMQQGLTKKKEPIKVAKPQKKLLISNINMLFNTPIPGLDKMTIDNLLILFENIKEIKDGNKTF